MHSILQKQVKLKLDQKQETKKGKARYGIAN
jgi:hypothetical protein